jgi:hypothetical protein
LAISMRHSAGLLSKAKQINYCYAARLGGRLSWRPLSIQIDNDTYQPDGIFHAVHRALKSIIACSRLAA